MPVDQSSFEADFKSFLDTAKIPIGSEKANMLETATKDVLQHPETQGLPKDATVNQAAWAALFGLDRD